jgi:hypothetical protein
VGDLNQGFCPLAQVFAKKVRNTIFRNDVVNMGASGDHAGSLLQKWYYAAVSFMSAGGQCNNGLATFT